MSRITCLAREVGDIQNYEKELIEAALAESNRKTAGPNGAAAKLGIPRSTLNLKIKQLKIEKHTVRYVRSLNSQNQKARPANASTWP